MNVKESIAAKLTQALAPSDLEVIDESERHRGHAGYRDGGESHFRVRVVSSAFAGKSRLDRHRLVNELLADELTGGVHALAVSALTPEEWRGAGLELPALLISSLQRPPSKAPPPVSGGAPAGA